MPIWEPIGRLTPVLEPGNDENAILFSTSLMAALVSGTAVGYCLSIVRSRNHKGFADLETASRVSFKRRPRKGLAFAGR